MSKKNLELYQLLCKLLKDEDYCANKVRESEAEVRSILRERLEEETKSELEISVYDTDRNERAKKHRKELVGGMTADERILCVQVSVLEGTVEYHDLIP